MHKDEWRGKYYAHKKRRQTKIESKVHHNCRHSIIIYKNKMM